MPGILSILYYAYIVYYTKKFDSTFSCFWLASGTIYIVLGVLVLIFPDWADYCIQTVVICVWIVFLGVEVLIVCAMAALPQKKADYIIILGAQVRGRVITGSLRRRLERGIRYLNENPETKCIVSGGKGKGEEISEAEAMAEYLYTHGIAADRVALEDKSTTTCENLIFSREFVKDIKKNKIGIVTNNFHIYRARKMAGEIGYQKVFALPASTDMVLFPNYMVREFFAFFIMFRELKKFKKHSV